MTKKLLALQIAIALVCLQAGILLAAGYGDGPGCGLGALVFKDGPKTIGHQVLAATTNGIGMQTFAISTGTSGCTNNGQIVKHEAVNVFASVNFESLSQEMAQGQGEHLASLATLMGVPAEHQPEFFAMTQDQYTALMQAGEASPAEMVQALHDAIAVHPVLAKVSLNR
ncbi:MAG: orotate phosphoribosyltransferase [Nitrospiraceae bacterium]